VAVAPNLSLGTTAARTVGLNGVGRRCIHVRACVPCIRWLVRRKGHLVTSNPPSGRPTVAPLTTPTTPVTLRANFIITCLTSWAASPGAGEWRALVLCGDQGEGEPSPPRGMGELCRTGGSYPLSLCTCAELFHGGTVAVLRRAPVAGVALSEGTLRLWQKHQP